MTHLLGVSQSGKNRSGIGLQDFVAVVDRKPALRLATQTAPLAVAAARSIACLPFLVVKAYQKGVVPEQLRVMEKGRREEGVERRVHCGVLAVGYR